MIRKRDWLALVLLMLFVFGLHRWSSRDWPNQEVERIREQENLIPKIRPGADETPRRVPRHGPQMYAVSHINPRVW